MKRSAKTISKQTKRAKRGTRERERTPSLSLPSHQLGSLRSLIFFCAFYPVFCFLSHKGAWSQARGRIKQKVVRSNLCSGKKRKPKKKIQGYTGFKYSTYAIRVLHQYQLFIFDDSSDPFKTECAGHHSINLIDDVVHLQNVF